MCHSCCNRGQGLITCHTRSLFLLFTHCVSMRACKYIRLCSFWIVESCDVWNVSSLKRWMSDTHTLLHFASSLADAVCISFVPISPTVTLSLMGVTRPAVSPDWPRRLNKTLCVCLSVRVRLCVCIALSVCRSLSHLITRVVLRWDTKVLVVLPSLVGTRNTSRLN